jgi:hypothetical protein
MIIRYAKVVLAFIITTVIMCVVNFVAQVVLILLDFGESSSFAHGGSMDRHRGLCRYIYRRCG